jgi:fructokinase
LSKAGIISFGEVMVDVISLDKTNTSFQTLLGGATVNVAVGIRRLGIPSYFLSKIGLDDNSLFVEAELKKEKVEIEGCVRASTKQICCVRVHINEHGERYFHAYINPTPDEWLNAEELKKEIFEKGKIFYFGSGTLFHPTARTTTEQALNYASECNMLVAFDTNIRLKRWESENHCRNTICSVIKKADIVKMADDELLFLTESKSLDEGLRKILQWDIPFLFVTAGKTGAYAVHDGKSIMVPGIEVNAIDTTGAGDAFMAAILNCFHEKGLPLNQAQLEEYTQFANQAGALSTTKLGSL